MGQNAEEFLSSFNRIEKQLREAIGNSRSMGFSELVRRLAKRRDLPVEKNEEDLLQMAQLRNAIVHERISNDFVIAEPNDWAVQRIKEIEKELTKPETVLPRFQKKVTGFEKTLPLLELLTIVRDKRYSQFPLYDRGVFVGLLTLRALGYWLAVESGKKQIALENRHAGDLLMENGKQTNYLFVSADTPILTVERFFREQATLEAILITQSGDPNGNLLGIIRPRDLYNQNVKDERM